jgi:hypothetical protein
MITQHWGPVLIATGHGMPSLAIMGHVPSVCMIIRVYSKTPVLGPTTRNARAGSQSTIHPMLTGRRRARATIALMALAGRIVTASLVRSGDKPKVTTP